MRTYEADEVDAMIARAIARDREQRLAREWIGLTNQELMDLAAIYSGAPLYCAIEAKLREKNA